MAISLHSEGTTVRVLAWPGYHAMANPYTRALYSALQTLGVEVTDFSGSALILRTFDIWHVHSPDHMLNRHSTLSVLARLMAFFGLLQVARVKQIRLVWTVNNLDSHEGWHGHLEGLMWRRLTRRVDGHIHYSQASLDETIGRYPWLGSRPAWIIPHGHYRGLYPDQVSRDEARAQLGLSGNARIITFFGSIRAYKNVPHLVRVFRRLEGNDLKLLVAGEPTSEERARVVSAAAGSTRVSLHLGLVPKERVQLFMRAADLVVLPFREILNSGSALLALSFDKPVLVPSIGALRDLQNRVGESWVHTYHGSLDQAALAGALDWAANARRPARPPLDGLDWPTIAQATLSAYQATLDRLSGTGRHRHAR